MSPFLFIFHLKVHDLIFKNKIWCFAWRIIIDPLIWILNLILIGQTVWMYEAILSTAFACTLLCKLNGYLN